MYKYNIKYHAFIHINVYYTSSCICIKIHTTNQKSVFLSLLSSTFWSALHRTSGLENAWIDGIVKSSNYKTAQMEVLESKQTKLSNI